MTRIRRIDRALFKGVSFFAQATLVGAVAASFWQVLTRFVFEAPADWTEVLTRALLIWSVLLGLALAFRHGAMLGVDLLRNLLGRLQRRWLALLNGLIALTCTGFLGFLAWIGVQMTWRVRFQTVPSLDIPISWVYAAIPVGATLAAIAVLARLAEGTPEAELRNDAQG